MFTISIIAFMILAVIAANARTLPEEVVWRLLMGASGAPVQSLSQVILLNAYPKETIITVVPKTNAVAIQAISTWVAANVPCMCGSAIPMITMSVTYIELARMTVTMTQPRRARFGGVSLLSGVVIERVLAGRRIRVDA